MILLDTTYVSPLLIEVLSAHEETIYDVKHQQFLKAPCIFQSIEQNESIIMNAEIGLNLLNELLPEHRLTTLANLFKNKIAFRKLLASKYPDFFYQSCSFEQLKTMNVDELPFPIVLKPIFGYGSEGVYKFNDGQAMTLFMNTYEQVNGREKEQFIIEQYIDGREFAIDFYYDEDGEPVVLNIFARNFKDSNDVGDRIYYTSKAIIKSTIHMFERYLKNFGENFQLKSVPLHIELRLTPSHEIIPIEINPLRFAGEGTTELGYYAYGINPYEYYFLKRQPNWEGIISKMDDAIYSFTCAEIDQHVDPSHIEHIDHTELKKQFNEVLDYRVLPLEGRTTFAVVFFKSPSEEEHTYILNLDFMQFITYKQYQL
ncbi:ATP-grasp domain-containing protein [Lysinibacillus sp. LZ02]|uniref:ATP-grasp domain-containing protein n=1 Tax=Lysinibacillus sp. LZ02 TaxID=3420668 RepID=UPI003D36F244